MSNGKGDKRRPIQISEEEFARRWKEVFGGGDVNKEENAIETKCESDETAD